MSQILIIEDHPLYRDALHSLISNHLPRQNLLLAGNVEDGLKLVHKQQAPLILLDLTIPGIAGIEAIHYILERHPESQVIVISGADDPLQVAACIGSGAVAFFSKNADPDYLIELIKDVVSGAHLEPVWLGVNGKESLSKLPSFKLTNRQVQVLALVCQGFKNAEIAEKLNVTEQTTKAHVSAIFRELGVVNRTQALLVAQRLGLKVSG